MENENNEKNILTDEELKKVDGGILSQMILHCRNFRNPKDCIKQIACKWENNLCLEKQ